MCVYSLKSKGSQICIWNDTVENSFPRPVLRVASLPSDRDYRLFQSSVTGSVLEEQLVRNLLCIWKERNVNKKEHKDRDTDTKDRVRYDTEQEVALGVI